MSVCCLVTLLTGSPEARVLLASTGSSLGPSNRRPEGPTFALDNCSKPVKSRAPVDADPDGGAC